VQSYRQNLKGFWRSAQDPSVAGKRQRIDLAGTSGHLPKKVGRKPGNRKPRPGGAADFAAGSAAGAGLGTCDIGRRTASRRVAASLVLMPRLFPALDPPRPAAVRPPTASGAAKAAIAGVTAARLLQARDPQAPRPAL
jgi:hypothetical protein